MACTVNHILIELGESRREEGRRIVDDKTMEHEGITERDIYRTKEIIRLRTVNVKLLAALGRILEETHDPKIEHLAQDAIDEATK